jgi:hypothetical protein
MGWLGWGFEQTLDTPVWALEMAVKAKREMLQMCFGGGEGETSNQPDKMIPASKENVTAMFRTLKSKAKGKASK